MPENRDQHDRDHENRLIDRELRQLLGGEGPAPDLPERFRARMVDASGRPSRRDDGDRRRLAAVRRIQQQRTAIRAGLSVAAALLLAVTVWVAWPSGSPPTTDPDARPDVPITIRPFRSRPMGNGADEGHAENSGHEEPDSPRRDPDVIVGPDQPDAPEDPAPRIPDRDPDVVDQPEQPDQPGTPLPRDPDPDVVERPEQPDRPDQPEAQPTDPRTTPDPRPELPVLAMVRATSRNARLRSRTGDGDWQAFDLSQPVVAGLSLSTTGLVDLTLGNGALVRFDGEVTLDGAADATTITVGSDDLYVDNLDCGGTLTVAVGDVSATVAGIALLEGHRSWFAITCAAGTIAAGGESLHAGQSARVRERRVDVREANIDDVWRARLLRDLPSRPLLRHDFDGNHATIHLNAGEQRDGSGHGIHSRGYPVRLEAVFPRITAVRGERVRMRLRFSDSTALGVGVWNDNERAFTHRQSIDTAGRWTEVEFDLPPGTPVTQLKFFSDEDPRESLALEIDWFEIVRQPVED